MSTMPGNPPAEAAQPVYSSHQTHEQVQESLVMEGARWQREALRSDDVIERAARALYETDREEEAGDEPRPTSIEGLNDMYRELARAALTAAIGDDDD